MPRTVYRYNPDSGKFEESGPPREADASIYVHTDEMKATVHPCDGNVYESKSAFRRVTKEHGCVEVGTGGLPKRKQWEPTGIRETLIDLYRNR